MPLSLTPELLKGPILPMKLPAFGIFKSGMEEPH
jgi:hypothetical protein